MKIGSRLWVDHRLPDGAGTVSAPYSVVTIDHERRMCWRYSGVSQAILLGLDRCFAIEDVVGTDTVRLRSSEKYSGLLGPLTQLVHGARTQHGFGVLGAAFKLKHKAEA